MSGAEIVGLISSVIAIIDGMTKVYDAIRDASGMPSTFRNVIRQLPLLKSTLTDAQQNMQNDTGGNSYDTPKKVLESCTEKINALEKIFRVVMVEPSTSRARRYASAIQTLGKGRRVEELMNSILADVQLLTASYAVKAVTKSQVDCMIMERGYGAGDTIGTCYPFITNYGTGHQSIHSGNGNQNINIGSGTQLCGTFTGSFAFPPS
ncbi:SesA protein [Hypomontagnella monticulosa]|nr:SesA protein [Hypomontagnella monticulosa]